MRAECQSCGAQLKDGWTLCGSCRKGYAELLDSLRVALSNLRQIANREVRLERGGHADLAVPQAPVNLSAFDLYDSVWLSLGEVAAAIGVWGSGEGLLSRMQARMDDLCRVPGAGSDYQALSVLLRKVQARCERREHKPFVGRCPKCGSNVEAGGKAVVAKCSCGAVLDVSKMRAETQAAFGKVHITTTQAGAARWCCEQTDASVTRKDVDNWIRRGAIDAVPEEGHFYEFPVGQLLRLAMTKHARLQVDAVA